MTQVKTIRMKIVTNTPRHHGYYRYSCMLPRGNEDATQILSPRWFLVNGSSGSER
jgi:hypothetical protein